MAIAHARKLTYEDYCKLPEKPRMELIDGAFLMSPSPNFRHQDLCAELTSVLRFFVKEHRLGKVLAAPMDVVLSKHDTVEPDILFVSRERFGIISEKNIQGPPDLVVEIFSPGHVARDQITKKALYEKHGVREYWMVDPHKKSIVVMNSENKKYRVQRTYTVEDTVTSAVISGFRLPVADLFID